MQPPTLNSESRTRHKEKDVVHEVNKKKERLHKPKKNADVINLTDNEYEENVLVIKTDETNSTLIVDEPINIDKSLYNDAISYETDTSVYEDLQQQDWNSDRWYDDTKGKTVCTDKYYFVKFQI